MSKSNLLMDRWRERRRRKAAIRELRAVDDRTLKDMGLTRGEIVAAVDGEVYRGGPVRSDGPGRLEAPAAAIEPAELERRLGSARQVRAEHLSSICARTLGRVLRRLRQLPGPRYPQRAAGTGAAAAFPCPAAGSADRRER